MAYYVDRMISVVWPLMLKSDLSEMEYYALFGLVMWQLGMILKKVNTGMNNYGLLQTLVKKFLKNFMQLRKRCVV